MPAKTLSELAESKMWDLFKHHENQVGSMRVADDTKGKEKTDCITYVIQVLAHAYTQSGRADVAADVRRLGRYGTELANYLVGLKWKAHYWNPDVVNPRDGEDEHPYSFHRAIQTWTYYRVPISGFIVNYNPTVVAKPKKQTPQDKTAFDKFNKVRFAYVIARGGKHTLLYSLGMLFEVHWTGIGDDLYERSAFWDFTWLSGIVVVPPDSDFVSGRK